MSTVSSSRPCRAKDPSKCVHHNGESKLSAAELFDQAMARNGKFREMENSLRWRRTAFEVLANKRPTKITKIMEGLSNYRPEDLAVLNEYNDAYSALMDNFTEKQMQAVHDYTGLSSMSVNLFLRDEEKFFKETRPEYLKSRHEHVLEVIAGLDSAFADAPHKERTVYRYLEQNVAERLTSSEAYANKLGYIKGEEVEFKSYLSTTIDPHLIGKYAAEDKEENTTIVFVIKTNKGIPVDFTATSSDQHNYIQTTEREILLPRNMKFKVDKVTRTVGFEAGVLNTNGRTVNPLTVHLSEITE